MTILTTTNPVGGDGSSPALGVVDPDAISSAGVASYDEGNDDDLETVVHEGRTYAGFWTFDGYAEPLPCDVADYVFPI